MKVAVMGRTRMLLATAERLAAAGHDIAAIWTGRPRPPDSAVSEDFSALAARTGAYFIGDASPTPERLAKLREAGCQVAVSVNWSTLLPRPVLELFPLGVLNAHAGDLPRYRGNACPNWAILMGEQRIGLCIHRMNDELDAGPVFTRDYFALSDDTYVGDVYAWLERRIPELFADVLRGLADGSATATPQPGDPALAMRCYPRRPDDGRIDWKLGARQIYRLIRASSRPFAGAFAVLEDGRRITIWRAAPHVPEGAFLAVPGQICFRLGGDPVIACGDGMLRLLEVESDGTPGNAVPLGLRTRLI